MLTRFHSRQLDFTDQSIDASAVILADLEKALKELDVKDVSLPLERAAVVPLNNCILKLTDPAHIAVNLLCLIFGGPHADIFVIGNHVVFGWARDGAIEPLDGLDIYKALHRVQVDSEFNCVLRADLCDGLYEGSL